MAGAVAFIVVVGGTYLWTSSRLIDGLIDSRPDTGAERGPDSGRDTFRPRRITAGDGRTRRGEDPDLGTSAGLHERSENRDTVSTDSKRQHGQPTDATEPLPPSSAPRPGPIPDTSTGENTSGTERRDSTSGVLNRRAVKEAIEEFEPVARDCYRDMLDEFPDADGTVGVDFRVVGEAGRGRVEMSRLDSDQTSLYHRRLHNCLLEKVGDLEFPSPDDGSVHVTYPIRFERTPQTAADDP